MTDELVSVYYHQQLVGQLAQTKTGEVAFEYHSQWLTNGFSISPLELPLEKKVFIAPPEPFVGLFGVFNDSLPDGWGQLLIDRWLRQQEINPNSVSRLARLCLVGSTGMGALEYQPESTPTTDFIPTKNDLAELASASAEILSGQQSPHLHQLVQISGSSGGARPKVLLTIEDEPWLIKFPAQVDASNIGKLEFLYSRMAKEAGLEMPPTKLFENKYFGVRRFDRLSDGTKVHMLSLAGLLNDNYRLPSLDYRQALEATLKITQNFAEVEKLYRQMCFNVFTKNLDDHSKNFSFLCHEGKWQLAPAYDLVKSGGINGEHATLVGGKGKGINETNLLAIAREIGLSPTKAKTIIAQINQALTTFRPQLAKLKVTLS